MIETSIHAWLGFVVLVTLSSIAGLALSRQIPWMESACQAHVPLVFGVMLGPFLAGMSIVLALLILPGASHAVHLWATASVLSVPCAGLFLRPACLLSPKHNQTDRPLGFWLLKGLLALWVAALLVNSVFIPLTQNDALEYAIVGRELFHARTLNIYPILNPETNISGFYGPWTHPPLYVSLIYLVSALQGHADEPGMMRLIAPWFLVVSTIGVGALGRLHSMNCGLLAALFFISTPLLFLGADSALIDALPVAGMILLLLLLAACNKNTMFFPFVLGTSLGFSLWTHSQSVLFIPIITGLLVLVHGLTSWRLIARDVSITLIVALAIAGAPYGKNWFLFGSPISDTPLVFAMPELDWSGYFRYARGLDHPMAVLQYGVLKGWFSLEAYGFVFWLGSLGIVALWIRSMQGRLFFLLRSGIREESPDRAIFFINAALLTIYLFGILISVLLGIDLMIRNERYLLVIIPAVALFAAYGLLCLAGCGWHMVQDVTAHSLRRDGVLFFSWIVTALLLFHLVIVGWFHRWRNVPERPRDTLALEVEEAPPFRDRFGFILNFWSSFRTVRQMSDKLPPNSLVLSLRPADMYYSDRKMISYLDPRLLPIYRERSPQTAVKRLLELGIRHVHVVDYSLPPLYHSVLQSILADPSLSKLEYSHGMFQVFSLEDSGLRSVSEREITPGILNWTSTTQIRLGGRKAMEALSLKPQILNQKNSHSKFSFFHRDYSVLLATGLAEGLGWANRPESFIQVEDAEYIVSFRLSGRGFIQLWIAQFDNSGRPIMLDSIERDGAMRIGELSLTEDHPQLDFARRLTFHEDAKFVRIGIEHVGRSHVTIEHGSVSRLAP